MKLYAIPRRATQSAQVVSGVIETDNSGFQNRKRIEGGPQVSRARRALIGILRKQRAAIAISWTSRHMGFNEVRSFVGRLAGDKDAAEYYRATYLEPLLELLGGALGGGKPAWAAVYLDERTRFVVPAELHLEAHEAILKGLVTADIADLAGRLAPRHRVAAAEILTALHAPLEPKLKTAPVRLLLIGDCVMTELRAFLTGGNHELTADLHIRHQYLSFKRGVGLNMPDVMEHINAGAVDLVGLGFFAFEGLPLYRALLADAHRLSLSEKKARVADIVRIVRDVVASIRASSDVPILLHNASGLRLSNLRRRIPFLSCIPRAKRDVIRLLNNELDELARGVENVVLIDEVGLTKAHGLRRASRNLIPRKLRKRALFNTSAFGPMLAEAYVPVISAYARLRRTKVLMIDFDNTLWHGVMADGEVKHFKREQRVLRQLREAGILLVAMSKNDPQSIRWNEMQLGPDDFVLHKISWNQKVASIDEAAQQLGLGLDSFTVIDDNPAERGLIAERFPQVGLLDPTQPDTWKAVELMLSFPNTRQTEESAARTALYRAAAGRNAAMAAEVDYPVMMRTLGLRATWSRARPKHLKRAHELLERTNQFNTTTKRRTLAELRNLLSDKQHRVFVCSLADRFGDLGVVAVVILELRSDSLVFDTLVMSCRAMGFGLESLLVRAPLDHMVGETGVRIRARGLFFPTDRNEPAASVFKEAGFSLDAERQWELLVHDPLPEIAEWLTVDVKSD